MKLETRLKQLYDYRDEAMLDPSANADYIADLNWSIEYFEKAIRTPAKSYEVYNGFDETSK
jgi:hypothetical protein